jgi:hypothetical protein
VLQASKHLKHLQHLQHLQHRQHLQHLKHALVNCLLTYSMRLSTLC